MKSRFSPSLRETLLTKEIDIHMPIADEALAASMMLLDSSLTTFQLQATGI